MPKIKTQKFAAATTAFSADLHISHALQVKHRGFISKDEMHDTMILNWNSTVSPLHNVFILGDIAMGRAEEAIEVLAQLNGTLHLIRGNHDKRLPRKVLDCFATVNTYLEIDIQVTPDAKQRLVLFHHPIAIWNRSHFDAWHLFGHSHGNFEGIGKSMDVGLDAVPLFAPIYYTDIEKVMATKQKQALDHHVGKGDDN